MKRIAEKDLDNLKFNGIIVSVPKNIKDGQHDDIAFVLECNYFTNGKHGYKEPGEGDCTSSFYNICYNMDCLPNGLWMNATCRFTIEHSFKFDSYDYYKFESMTDFCVWYLRRQTTDKEDKNWIQEKCGTNTPPTSVPEKTFVGNKKKDDVYETINKLHISESEKISLYQQIKQREKHSDYIMKLHNEIANDVLRNELHDINKVMIYWDLYNNPETDEKLRKLIEEEWPEFKERPPEHYVRTIGEDGKPECTRLMSKDEIREKINPGWNTRREKLKDVIEYLHKYEHVCDLRDKVRNGSIPRIEYTQTIADLEDWLDEEI